MTERQIEREERDYVDEVGTKARAAKRVEEPESRFHVRARTVRESIRRHH